MKAFPQNETRSERIIIEKKGYRTLWFLNVHCLCVTFCTSRRMYLLCCSLNSLAWRLLRPPPGLGARDRSTPWVANLCLGVRGPQAGKNIFLQAGWEQRANCADCAFHHSCSAYLQFNIIQFFNTYKVVDIVESLGKRSLDKKLALRRRYLEAVAVRLFLLTSAVFHNV